jgi:hypothetical protein
MASQSYTWGPYDTIWSVAGRFWRQTTWADVPTFVTQIQVANPQIIDWRTAPAQYRVTGCIPSPNPSGTLLNQPYSLAVAQVGNAPQAIVAQPTQINVASPNSNKAGSAPVRDVYVDLTAAGTYFTTAVATGAVPPVQAPGTARLYKVTTDGSTYATPVVGLAPKSMTALDAVAQGTVVSLPLST